MSETFSWCADIGLHVKGRIQEADALRQERTAREILRRLRDRPGIILADEVGMGKTFVALAVAVSVALSDPQERPVVVMVPSSLKDKWPSDFRVFREKCLPASLAQRLDFGRADNGVDFLRLLDNPPARRKRLIFVTHGAMSRGLNDGWVKLAIIRQALRGRWGAEDLRRSLGKIMGVLLRMTLVEREAAHGGRDLWYKLLTNDPTQWLNLLHERGIELDDDPVPTAVLEALPGLDTSGAYKALGEIPLRRSKNFDQRVTEARRAINNQMQDLWGECLVKLNLRLPLLILDEAHHLKNPSTKLASLFHVQEAKDDADTIKHGRLGGVFERMLFLTATPFQLGHAELCSVLDRFNGIAWDSPQVSTMNREQHEERITALRQALDEAQEAALALDSAWSRLCVRDLRLGQETYPDAEAWWTRAKGRGELTSAGGDVAQCYRRTQQAMLNAQELLRPWVIRHLRSRCLLPPFEGTMRRRRICGRAIRGDDEPASGEQGIPVQGRALLPFLLAARAAYQNPDARPVFAEGLASSYEAFLSTRRKDSPASEAVEDEGGVADALSSLGQQSWHLEQLERLLPADDASGSAAHPKVAATVERVVRTWSEGEKVVVFCHWVVTGKVLRRRISEALHEATLETGRKKLACKKSEVEERLARVGERFERDSPMRRTLDSEVEALLAGFGSLRQHQLKIQEVIRRYVRTPSFLVRFFPLNRERFTGRDMRQAMNNKDNRSKLTLRQLLKDLFAFLQERCVEDERREYLDALMSVQTGLSYARGRTEDFQPDEMQGEAPSKLLPNVRLVNGATTAETRRRLMLAFNTPFYPEVLIASSVLAEGVDLHLNCRYIIHHDLCWNPSTLEQRTGRVDRIGAKVERCGRPVRVYLPYVAATQDEKMFRVVMDRERWFNVVMGEEYKMDLVTTDRMAERIPLPEAMAKELMFDLSIA